LSADEIQEALRERGYKIGTATLYQNLSRLADNGLIRYDSNLAPHHHLICTRCGRISDVPMDELQLKQYQSLIVADDALLKDWDLQDLRLDLRGLCPSCRDK
jgi:Fur family peroxide stress response transcriptional regulator